MFSLPRLTPQQQAATDAKLWQQRESERLQQQAAQDAEDLEWDRVSEKRKLREQDPIAQRPTKVGGHALSHTLCHNLCHDPKTQQRAEAAEQVEARAAEEPLPKATPNSVELTKATTTTAPATTEDDPSPASTGEQFRLVAMTCASAPAWDKVRHCVQWIGYAECIPPETRKKEYQVFAYAYTSMQLCVWGNLFPTIDMQTIREPIMKECFDVIQMLRAEGEQIIEFGVRPELEFQGEAEHSQEHDDSQEDEHTSEDDDSQEDEDSSTELQQVQVSLIAEISSLNCVRCTSCCATL
jgi:hypothetical protein